MCETLTWYCVRTNNLEQFRSIQKLSADQGDVDAEWSSEEHATQEQALEEDEGGRENIWERIAGAVSSKNARQCEARHRQAYPKVIITCRSELLSTQDKYENRFLPIESQNIHKDETHEAMLFYEEIRLVSFEDKQPAYQLKYAALLWRKVCCKTFTKLATAPPQREIHIDMQTLQASLKEHGLPGHAVEQLAQVYVVSTLPCKGEYSEDAQKETAALLEAAGRWFEQLKHGGHDDGVGTDSDRQVQINISIVAMLAALSGLDLVGEGSDKAEVISFLRRHTFSDEAMWTGADFEREFKAIPELASLVDTPFMVEIVTTILQQLKQQERAQTEIKSQLAVMLDEETAEVAWALLRKAGNSGSSDLKGLLKEIQKALERDADADLKQKWAEQLHTLAEDIVQKSSTAKDLVTANKAKPTSLGDEANALREEAIALVEQELYNALQRPATSRAAIYKMFFLMWVEREASKAAGQRQGISAEVLRMEAIEFALQLAAYLSGKSKVVISQGKRSTLFAAKRDTDIFFKEDELTKAARSAGPLKKVSSDGESVMFIHKTLQEYCAAVCVLRGITQAVEATLISPSELCDKVKVLAGDEQSTQAGSRQTATLLGELLESLTNSAFNKLALELETALLDFICDRLCEDVVLVQQVNAVSFVLLTCQVMPERRLGQDLVQLLSQLELALQNLQYILVTGKMPRRSNGTVLHAAASAGNIRLIDAILSLPFSSLTTGQRAVDTSLSLEGKVSSIVHGFKSARSASDDVHKMQALLAEMTERPIEAIPTDHPELMSLVEGSVDERIKILCEHADPKAVDKLYQSMLRKGSRGQRHAWIEASSESQADSKWQDDQSATRGSSLTCTAVDLEVEDDAGKTPLFRAVEEGHVACAELLLNYGADSQTRRKDSQTPFVVLQGDQDCWKCNQGSNTIVSDRSKWEVSQDEWRRHGHRETGTSRPMPLITRGSGLRFAVCGVPSIGIRRDGGGKDFHCVMFEVELRFGESSMRYWREDAPVLYRDLRVGFTSTTDRSAGFRAALGEVQGFQWKKLSDEQREYGYDTNGNGHHQDERGDRFWRADPLFEEAPLQAGDKILFNHITSEMHEWHDDPSVKSALFRIEEMDPISNSAMLGVSKLSGFEAPADLEAISECWTLFDTEDFTDKIWLCNMQLDFLLKAVPVETPDWSTGAIITLSSAAISEASVQRSDSCRVHGRDAKFELLKSPELSPNDSADRLVPVIQHRLIVGVVLDVDTGEMYVGLNGQHWAKTKVDPPADAALIPAVSIGDLVHPSESDDLIFGMNCGERPFQHPFFLGKQKASPARALAQGESAVLAAARKHHPKAVLLLLQDEATRGDAVNQIDSVNGQTILHLLAGPVVDPSAVQSAGLLLDQKQELLEVKDSHGRTALSWAIEHDYQSFAELLLERGAQVDAQIMAIAREHMLAAPRGLFACGFFVTSDTINLKSFARLKYLSDGQFHTPAYHSSTSCIACCSTMHHRMVFLLVLDQIMA